MSVKGEPGSRWMEGAAMGDTSTVGDRLLELRRAKGFTQKELGAPRYTHAYVSSIEHGHRNASRKALEYFAVKLGVDVEELVTGTPRDLAAQLELRLMEARIALSSGRLEDAAAAFRSIAREAKRHGIVRLQGGVEEGLGLLEERRDRPEEALAHYQKAEDLLRDEPVTARVDAVAGKARAFHSLGDTRYEIHLLESMLAAIEREGLSDPGALARVHSGLVFAYLEAGLYQKAADSATELEALSPRLMDPQRVGQMHMHVARLHLVQGRVDDALHSLERAGEAFGHVGFEAEVGHADLARGYVLSRQGDYERALQELERARAVFEAIGDDKDLARALNELGHIERVHGSRDRARKLLETSLSLAGSTDTPITAWAHRELGLVLAEIDPASAEKHLRTAIEQYELSEQPIEVASAYRALGDVLEGRGEHAAGTEAYRAGLMAMERLT
jgi:tetratricopeptide (TPR) repeat protein